MVSDGQTASSPHCSWASTCHYDDASKQECASALCQAKGYSGGHFVESNQNFCSVSLTSSYIYVYLLDRDVIQLLAWNAESRITADCITSGEILCSSLVFYNDIL